MIRLLSLLVLLVAGLLAPPQASGHALEPGFLEIEAQTGGEYRVTWRKPQVNGAPMGIDAVLPDGCAPQRGPEPRFDGRAFVTGWIATCTPAITQGEVWIDGLSRTATDVLVRFVPEPGGKAQTLRLTPDADRVALPPVPSAWQVARNYTSLGIDHILSGLDHLLFVAALLLLIRDVRRLVAAITAFTVAHSITLAAAALGWISLPVRPVEAVIALSIVFLAAEILANGRNRPSLAQTAPWVVAFAFGLLHGMGFATALREIGLPDGDIPLALVSFNVGVEIGQLLFIAVILLMVAALRLMVPGRLATWMQPDAPGLRLAAYAIGGIAAFWTIERVVGFVA